MTGVSLDDVNKNKMLIYHGGSGGGEISLETRSTYTQEVITLLPLLVVPGVGSWLGPCSERLKLPGSPSLYHGVSREKGKSLTRAILLTIF